MKDILLLLIAVVLFSTIFSCRTEQTSYEPPRTYTPPPPPVTSGPVQGETFVSEGWVNDNTFVESAVGMPKAGSVEQIQRRATAKEAAILSAQKKVVEKFVGSRISGIVGVTDIMATGVAIQKEFSGTVRNYTIVKETYDQNDNCQILFQVQEDNLKQRVSKQQASEE